MATSSTLALPLPRNRSRDLGSRTAEIVAVSRARHLLRHRPPHIFSDPYAIHFVGPRWLRVLRSDLLDALFSRVLVRRLMPVTIQHLVRAAFAESCLDCALRAGVRQYVILGSGFDTFALRRAEHGLRVFEVELEATLSLKLDRMTAAGLRAPPHVRFVPFDFERDNLHAALRAAGFDCSKRAFFSWMGVTYYLTPRAIIDTVERVASIACAGSSLVFDYLLAAPCVPRADRALFLSMMAFVARRGEPMVARFDPEHAPAVFNPRRRWSVVENLSPAGCAARFVGVRPDLPPLAPITWFLHLTRVR